MLALCATCGWLMLSCLYVMFQGCTLFINAEVPLIKWFNDHSSVLSILCGHGSRRTQGGASTAVPKRAAGWYRHDKRLHGDASTPGTRDLHM